MSDKPLFVRIFEGKDLEDWIDIDYGLLSKLVASGVIESRHRIDIEETPTQHKAGKLVRILSKRSDDLVPKFYDALIRTGQQHIADKLGYGAAHSQPPVPANQAATAAGLVSLHADPPSGGKYGTKLSNARGDLVQLINVNAFFLSNMMYGEVLSQDKKRVIQSLYQGDVENQMKAKDQLIDIVVAAGDVGFETLVRALARSDQESLAKQLDEELAERFIKKPSEVAKKLDDLRGDLLPTIQVDNSFLAHMMKNAVISKKEKNEILSSNDKHARVDKLLDLVSDKLDRGDKTAFNQLVYALVRTVQLPCARMLDEEMTEIYHQENDGKNVMSTKHQQALKSARCDLLKSVRMSEMLLSHLIANYIITSNMKELIEREGTEDDKVGKLLDLLEGCGPNAFDVFVKALVDTNQQHAAKILTDAVKST